MKMQSSVVGAAAIALSGLLLGPAWAQSAPSVPVRGAAPAQGVQDVDGDEKRAEEEWRRAQGAQGQREGRDGPSENPLLEILELMEQVESRLFEADTGGFTQEEQRKIIEAMRFEDKTSSALEDLIQEVERQQQQQQQQGSGEPDPQQQQGQQGQPESEQQRQERMERERERELERQRQRQQRQQQQQQDQPQDQQTAEERQSQQESQRQQEERSHLDPAGPGGAGQWGRLPRKLHQDARNAANQEPPRRWSELIERYRTRLANPED